MSQRLLLASAALFGGLIFLAPSWGDEPKPVRPDLEKRLDALQKEIEALRKELQAKPSRRQTRLPHLQGQERRRQRYGEALFRTL